LLPQTPPGTLYHADRGSQCCAEAPQQILTDHNVIAGMSRKGNFWDNACSKSFFGSLKQRFIYHTRTMLLVWGPRQEIFNCIEVFNNRQRRDATIGYISPTKLA
jgi:transposase InsO family protein